MVSFETACCDDHFAGLPDPALLPWLCYALVFCSFCEQVSEKNMRYDNRAGVRDRTHLFSPFIPQSHHPGQGHIRQSPAGYFHLTHQGLDGPPPPKKKKMDAPINLMLFVFFFCMDASIAACQKGCESRVLSGKPWTLATGVLKEGCVLSWEHWAKRRYGDKQTTQTQDKQASWREPGLWQLRTAMVLFFFFLPEINIVNRSLSGERNRCVIELKWTDQWRHCPFNTVTLINSVPNIPHSRTPI